MNLTEIFRTRIEIDGNPAINEIGKLELQVKELKSALKSIPKETEEWKTLSKQAQEIERLMQASQRAADRLSFALTTQAQKIDEVKKQITLLSQAENKDEAQIKKLTQELKSLENQYQKTSNSLAYQNSQLKIQGDALKEVNQKLKVTAQQTQEYVAASQKLEVVENKLQEVRKATGLLGMTMSQLKQVQKEYNQQLEHLTFGTAKYDEVKKQIQEVNAVIQHQREDLRDTRTSWQKLKDSMRDMGNMAMGNIWGELAMRAFDGMTQALVGTVTQAAKLSDELADIARFTGFSAEETLKLNQQLSQIQTRTGTGDLREIVMVAGQLGVAKEDILGFVQSIDMASVALSKEFGGSSEAVANALGKLKGLFAETKNMNFGEAMSRIGSALTAAGAASAASAPQIADFTQRIGAIGELGPKLTENLGLGTALLDLGLSSEIAASGLQALFLTAGKEAEAFAKQIGITKEEFVKLQNEDPNKMILLLAQSFKGLNNDQVMAGLQRMGITSGETVKVMALLKDNTDKVVNAQTLMRKEFDANTKLTEAFNIKMQTFGAQVDLAKKEINGLVASISSALLPVMTKGIELIVSFVMILKAMPKFLDDNKVAIASLVVAMVAFNSQAIIAQAQIIRTNFSFLALQTSLRSAAAATGITTVAQYALNTAMKLNPIGLVVTAIALLVAGFATLYNNSETVRTAIDDLWQSLVRVWDYTKILYEEIKKIDFAKPFENVISTFEQMQASLQKLGTEMLVFLENISGNSESIYDKVSNYIASIFDELSKKVSNSLAEVGKGWVQFGQMYADFGRQIMETGFVESIKQALTEVGKGWVEYGKMYVDTYNQIANYDYQTAMLNFKNSVENSLIAATKTIKNYAQIYLDFTNEILNSSFSENISKALSEVGRGFVAYAKIFTDFGKDVVNTYLGVQKDVENIFNDLADSVKDFVTENFGTELESIQKAWLQFSTAIDEVKTSFDNLTNSISTTFNALSDNTVSRAIEKMKSVFQTSNTLLAEKIARDTGTMPAAGSLLRNPSATQKQNEKHALFPELLPKKPKEATPKQSPEDLALIEANKKRAKELEEEEKKKKVEKDTKDRENLNKKNEERKRLTEQALKDLQAMELQMMAEGQEKELLQLEYKYQELYGKVAEAHKNGLADEIATAQIQALDKLSGQEKEKILEKYRQLGIDKANAEQDAIIATKKQLAEKELAAIEANKANKDAKATLTHLDTQNNLVGDFLATDDNSEKAAIQEQIKVADFDHKQVLLGNENWFQKQKLAILQKYGLLTDEQEQAILLKQAEAEKQKTANTIAEAERRKQASQAEFKATLTSASGLVGALGNLQNALGKDGEEWIDFKNALTLAQIGIDTASAISSLTAASSANPSNAVTFGAAGAIQFATGVVSIMANIAKATSILSGANKPKAPTSKAASASSSGSGESGYFEGGKVRREAAGFTGGSSIYEPIPMIAHGGEYIIPNWLMKTPPVANFVNMVEAVRTGRNSPSSLNNTQKTSPQNGFFEGGFNSNNKNNPNQEMSLMMEVLINLTNQVEEMKNTPLRAAVVERDISEMQTLRKQLDNDAMLN